MTQETPGLAAETATEHSGAHASEKSYLVIFGWLFALSSSAYIVDLMSLPKGLQWCFFVIIACMKVTLIAAYFMHLRYERLNLIYTLVLPLILLVALVAAVLPDGLSVLLLRR